MKDTIYRDDAIKALKDSVVEMGGDDFCEMGVHIDDIEAVVNAIPSADRPHVGYTGVDEDYLVSVQEVLNITAETGALETQRRVRELARKDRPQGKWIRDRYWSRGAGMGEEYGFFYKCSLCEYEVENGYTRCDFNFCPNCGARMKGADDDMH